jgi:flagellar secretion chaperone FliS
MSGNDAASAYHQTSAHGGSPVAMIVALYDTILRDFRRALVALEAGNVETRVFELNHALTVIGHLEEVLDHKRGGAVAKRFEGFYRITRGLIVAANAEPNRKSIDDLIEMYGTLRLAWQEADRKLQGSEAPASVPAASPSSANEAGLVGVPVGALDTEEAPRKNWSA